MPRPLGFWLADECWQLLVGDTPSAPWQYACSAGAGGDDHAAGAQPVVLCRDVQDALSHNRSQLQLQSYLFQLVLESQVAAPLVPQGPFPGADGAKSSAQHSKAAKLKQQADQERFIAMCRLAHMLLIKGAWNQVCSIVQRVEDQGEPWREL